MTQNMVLPTNNLTFKKLFATRIGLWICFFVASLNAAEMPPEKKARTGLESRPRPGLQAELEEIQATSSRTLMHASEALERAKRTIRTDFQRAVVKAIEAKKTPEELETLSKLAGNVRFSSNCYVISADIGHLLKNGHKRPTEKTTFDTLMDQLFYDINWRTLHPSQQGLIDGNRIINMEYLEENAYPSPIGNLTAALNKCSWTVFDPGTGMVFQKIEEKWKILIEVVVYCGKLMPKNPCQEDFAYNHFKNKPIKIINNSATGADLNFQRKDKIKSFFVFEAENGNIDATRVYAILKLPDSAPMLFLIPNVFAEFNPDGSCKTRYNHTGRVQEWSLSRREGNH